MSLLLIHECANAHGGDLSILKKTIKTFSKSEFNNRHIKFQAFKYDKISSSDFHHYELYKELYNTSENWEEIIEFTSSFYDGIWLDIFDVFGCEIFVKNYQKIYGIKLQSSVLNNYEVLSALSGFNFENHKLILNISGFSLLEINKLVKNIITNLSIPLSNIVLQVGFQSYPTEIEDCGIHKISLLRKEFV